jgi:hypothetical protein
LVAFKYYFKVAKNRHFKASFFKCAI